MCSLEKGAKGRRILPRAAPFCISIINTEQAEDFPFYPNKKRDMSSSSSPQQQRQQHHHRQQQQQRVSSSLTTTTARNEEGELLDEEKQRRRIRKQRILTRFRRKSERKFFLASATVTRLLDIPYGKKGESVKVPSHHILDDEEESNAPLIAGGVRRKKVAAMLNVDVYVIGLYFLPKACKKHEGEEDALDAVANDSSIAKTVRLTFVRDVSGESVAKAIAVNIEKKLGSRAESGGNEESEKKAKEALEMFKSMFRSVKIEKGASLTFSTNESGTLTTRLRGKKIGESIKDERLCGALFESWCGPDSVIPEMTEAASSILSQALKLIPSEDNNGGGSAAA